MPPPQVCSVCPRSWRIPVSRAYFYELISADQSLRPIKFGALSFWTSEQIDALERRIRDGTAKRRRPTPANTPTSNSFPPPPQQTARGASPIASIGGRTMLPQSGSSHREPSKPSRPAEAIAEALKGRRSGKGWMARCPAHPDTTPSLSINETPTRKVLVKCFAGCSQAEVIAALRRRGLWPGAARDCNRSDACRPGE